MKKKIMRVVLPIFMLSGQRLDQVLSKMFNQYSRSYIKKLILSDKVLINDQVVNAPDKKILGGENIIIYPFAETFHTDLPENVFLNIIYEDNDILVINKDAGLVVHPGAGNLHGTILNALLYRYNNIHNLPRSGIVHRLDKNTSGLMVIAKNMYAYIFLLNLIKKREIVREYQAIVHGNIISGGIIDSPIMRHKTKKICMMISSEGKKAITYYKIIKRFQGYTHLSLKLDTGRTHQIRVHMLHIGYPLIGDSLYRRGNFFHVPKVYEKKNAMIIKNFSRQALHSSHLSFCHPNTKKIMHWYAPFPKDMCNLIHCLLE